MTLPLAGVMTPRYSGVMTIRLSKTAPWNTRLGNPYRTRYAQVGDMKFRISADDLTQIWWVEHVDHDGNFIDDDKSRIAWGLTQAREIIESLASGGDYKYGELRTND